MTTNQTLFFDLPQAATSGSRRWRRWTGTSTPERSTTASSCGVQVIFQAVAAEDYVPPPRARRDCRFCNPDPLFIHPYKTTYSLIEKED